MFEYLYDMAGELYYKASDWYDDNQKKLQMAKKVLRIAFLVIFLLAMQMASYTHPEWWIWEWLQFS